MQFKSIIGQKELISNLTTSFKENRVAHTQLFLGDEGYGALPLAIAYSQFLLCTNKQSDDSCGVCPSCKKFDKYAHPDLHFYFPTATNQTIKKKSQIQPCIGCLEKLFN
jgi:DNA polymerase-3 subunit delta'